MAAFDKKTVRAWAMYDWSNSVYSLVIASAIFPAYYNEVTANGGSNKVEVFGWIVENTAIYSITLGLAFGLIGLLSPFISSVADYKGNHRYFMKAFCWMGAVSCGLLFFFTGPNILWGLACLALATIGYAGSIVFYNAYLPAIAPVEKQDQVSARGYAYGYIGSTTLLILCLAAILSQEALGIEDGTLLPRLSFLLVGLWWIGFAQITFHRLPAGIYRRKASGNAMMKGYYELLKVYHRLREEPGLRSFLMAFFFYIMGVQTVMFMAASFGEKEIGLSFSDLIITILVLEYVAIGGAFLFARLSRKYGNIPALMIAVCAWIGICVGAWFISNALDFYITGFFIGLVMGGIQSLSRSTYAKMIPKTENNAGYFGFYDVCEKLAIMCGLVMFGYLDHLTGSMRSSIVTLGLWFLIGLVFLKKVGPMMTSDNQNVKHG